MYIHVSGAIDNRSMKDDSDNVFPVDKTNDIWHNWHMARAKTIEDDTHSQSSEGIWQFITMCDNVWQCMTMYDNVWQGIITLPVGETCTVSVVRAEWSWASWRWEAQVYTFVRRLKNIRKSIFDKHKKIYFKEKKQKILFTYLLLEKVHSGSQCPDVLWKLCQRFPEKDIARIIYNISSWKRWENECDANCVGDRI